MADLKKALRASGKWASLRRLFFCSEPSHLSRNQQLIIAFSATSWSPTTLTRAIIKGWVKSKWENRKQGTRHFEMIKLPFWWSVISWRHQKHIIICEWKRGPLAPARFDFSGRNWISRHCRPPNTYIYNAVKRNITVASFPWLVYRTLAKQAWHDSKTNAQLFTEIFKKPSTICIIISL